jgi:acyl carrier protein
LAKLLQEAILELKRAGTTYVLIEELPLFEDEHFAEFLSKFCGFLIDSPVALQGVEFVLSSIKAPNLQNVPQRGKVAEQLKFLSFLKWRSTDLWRLVIMLQKALGIEIEDGQIEELIAAADGSPRFVKLFFREYRYLQMLGDTNVSQAIAHTRSELGS